MPAPVASVLRWEAGNVTSVGLAARRRLDGVGSEDVVLRYTDGIGAIMGTVLGLGVLEIGIAHLVVPWPAVRAVLLGLGLWTLLEVGGFWAGLVTHPHLAGPDGLTLRLGHQVAVSVGWGEIEEVRRASVHEPTSVVVRDGTLHLPVTGSTNLMLVLAQPRPLPQLVGRRREGSRIAFQADEPAVALGAVRDWTAQTGGS